jgi:hypothetical protein
MIGSYGHFYVKMYNDVVIHIINKEANIQLCILLYSFLLVVSVGRILKYSCQFM